MKPPRFWSRSEPDYRARLLSPLSAAWMAASTLRRHMARPATVACPVICVGNVTLGGAGKTPVSLDIATRLIARGASPHFLTRGYGGRQTGPLRVDPDRHSARDVGDEPLLLARSAPTWIAKDRAAGAQAAVGAGASHIVMDDGFQNPGLEKTLSIVVIDAHSGLGNGCVFPAGPLREPLDAALARADAIVILGTGSTPGLDFATLRQPVLYGRLHAERPESLPPGTRCVAFAGIGRPEKFFETLSGLELELSLTREFPDHYRYRESDLDRLVRKAEALEAKLVTTEKDAVRLPARFRDTVTALPVSIVWDEGNDGPLALIQGTSA